MAKDFLTDEEVEIEIERLKHSEAYKLGIAEKRFKYRRRQQMYNMRMYEKRGRELMAEGRSFEDFRDSENDES